MKKSLLIAMLASSSMMAYADKVVFIADGSQEFYSGDATQKIISYSGEIEPTDKVKSFYLNSNFGQIDFKNTFVTNGSFRLYKGTPIKFTPNAGITIKTIKMLCQSTEAKYQGKGSTDNNVYSFDASSRIQTYNLNSTEAVTLTFSNYQCRATWIEVEYSGTSTQVIAPLPVDTYPAVQKDKTVKYTCATEGAKIQYSLTGENDSWIDYPADGIKIESDAMIYTKAVKSGMTDSFVTNNSYIPVAAETTETVFCFNDWDKLPLTTDGKKFTREDLVLDSSAAGATVLTANSKIDVHNTTFKQGNITLTLGPDNGGSRLYRSATFGGHLELRAYGSTAEDGVFDNMTISAPENEIIENVVFMVAQWPDTPIITGMDGDFKADTYSSVFVCKKNETTKNTLNIEFKKVATSTPAFYISHIHVYTRTTGNAGVTDLSSSNAPVEYFNMQGIKVNNPANGIFIRKEGNKITKVVM